MSPHLKKSRKSSAVGPDFLRTLLRTAPREQLLEDYVKVDKDSKSSDTKTSYRNPPRALLTRESILGTRATLSQAFASNAVFRFPMFYSAGISASAAGTVAATVTSMDPSVCTDWTNISSIFAYFRVIGVHVTTVTRLGQAAPAIVSPAQYNSGCYYLYADWNNAAPSVSIGAALQTQEISLVGNTPSKFERYFKFPVQGSAAESGQHLWISTSSPSSYIGSINMASPVGWFPPSTEVAECLFRYDLEFSLRGT